MSGSQCAALIDVIPYDTTRLYSLQNSLLRDLVNRGNTGIVVTDVREIYSGTNYSFRGARTGPKTTGNVYRRNR